MGRNGGKNVFDSYRVISPNATYWPGVSENELTLGWLCLSPSAKQCRNPCLGSPPVYQDLSARHDWPVKNAIVDLPIRPGLLEAWLVLTSDKYHGNIYILIPLNQRLALTRLRATGPRLKGNLTRISGSPLSPWRTQKQGSRRCCADVTIRVNLRLRRRLDPPFQPAFLSHKIADNTSWKGGEPDGTPSELKKRVPSEHLALLFFFNASLEKL